MRASERFWLILWKCQQGHCDSNSGLLATESASYGFLSGKLRFHGGFLPLCQMAIYMPMTRGNPLPIRWPQLQCINPSFVHQSGRADRNLYTKLVYNSFNSVFCDSRHNTHSARSFYRIDFETANFRKVLYTSLVYKILSPPPSPSTESRIWRKPYCNKNNGNYRAFLSRWEPNKNNNYRVVLPWWVSNTIIKNAHPAVFTSKRWTLSERPLHWIH